MKTRFFALPTLILTLALFPILVSGDTPSSLAAASSGPLSFVQAMFDTGLEGAACIALSPDEQYVYIASSIGDAVTVFRRDDASGRLAFVQVWRDGEGGANELEGATGIAVSPDGGHVYVASWHDDSLTVFSRSGSTGKLTFVETHQDGVGGIVSLDGAGAVIVSPDNKHVYVASSGDSTVSVFSRDTSTGALTFVEAEGGLASTYSVAVSPDGSYVYVAGRWDDAVAYFWRNPSSGALTYQGMVQDGVDGVDGLDGARALAISPDGSQVYVASQYDHALAVFDRSASDGSLTFVAVHKDGVGGVDGLDTADGIAVSPDGAHVYVGGYGDDAVAVFARWKIHLPLVLRSV